MLRGFACPMPLCLLRFGRGNWLVDKKARFAPAIYQYGCYQGQTSEQIRPQHIAGPVFAQVNAGDANESYQDADEQEKEGSF